MRRAINIAVVALAGIVGAVLGYYLAYALGLSKAAAWPPTRAVGTGAYILAGGLSLAFLCVAAAIVVYIPGRGSAKGEIPKTASSSGEAKVLSVRPTGTWRDTPEGKQYKLVVELEVLDDEDGPSYYAKAKQFVSEELEERLQEGRKVAIRRDPADPKTVAIVDTKQGPARSRNSRRRKKSKSRSQASA